MSGRAFYRYQPLFAAHIIHRRQTAHSHRRDDFVRQTVNRAAQHIFSVIYIHLDEIFADVYVKLVSLFNLRHRKNTPDFGMTCKDRRAVGGNSVFCAAEYVPADIYFAAVFELKTFDIVNIPLHIFLKNFEMFCIGINPHGA